MSDKDLCSEYVKNFHNWTENGENVLTDPLLKIYTDGK